MNINFANAQSMRYIGEADGDKIYITANKDATRLGKGVLAWIISESDQFLGADKYYFPCDARAYFSEYDFKFSYEDSRSKRLQDLNRYLKDNQKIPTTTSIMVEWNDSDMKLKDKIKFSIKEICASATPEKKGNLFPFTESTYNKQKNRSTIFAILSGTFVRKGDFAEGWMRTYYTKKKDVKMPDGKPMLRANGTPFTITELAEEDGYHIDKISINCKDNKFAFLQTNEYDSQGQSKNSSVATGAGIKYSEAVPNSTGESFVTVICSIY